MEHLFDGIGGFNSWEFAAVAFGGIVLGLVLVAVFRYWGIVGIAGGFPIFAYLSAEAGQVATKISDPIITVGAAVAPVLWASVWILIIVSVAGRTGLAKGLGKQ